MNRHRFLVLALSGLLAVSATCLSGCSDPTSDEVREGIGACEHEWFEGAGGKERCKKCGIYKSKAEGDDAGTGREETTDDSKTTPSTDE